MTTAGGGSIERAAIQLVEVGKAYGQMTVVDRVSLEIDPGEFVTLLGPSGSGKTTTLMMIAGFVVPTTGRVLLAGTDITPIPPHRRNLGVVFQHYALFPHMTVSDNVAYPLWMRRTSAHETAQRVGQVIGLVQLTGKEGRYPRELSGGEQQRVALARALVFAPSALLMDEPLGALDRKLREHVQIEIRSLQRRLGITTIHVTHDQDEAFAMSDRIVVIDHGRVEQVGEPREIYDRPATAFVAEFVGESNVWKGTIERQSDGGHALLTTAGQRFPLPDRAYRTGRPARMIVRPEAIRLDAGPERARLLGVLLDVVYAGGMTKYIVSTNNGQVIKAVSGGPARERGERVGVTWNPEAAHLFQEE
jgi:putative spermidine/putrescine transport system ATP-binding protein